MKTIATITWLTLHEARRRRMVLAALLLGGSFVLLFIYGFSLIDHSLRARALSELTTQVNDNLMMMAGFYVIHFLAIMLTVLASVDTVAGEISSHTIQTIVTKPLGRWQIMVGKWLGYALMISAYLLLLGGSMLVAIRLLAHYTPPHSLEALVLMILEALIVLSLSLLGGTRLSTLTNGVMLFMLYGIAFIGGWVEQVGSLIKSDGAVKVGIASSLVLPVEALWHRAAYLMQPPLLSNIPTPFSFQSVPSGEMVIYAACYGVVALLLAITSFNRRDL